jgi:predicted SnoaL-like aldol condensation-catalyzing enzyme
MQTTRSLARVRAHSVPRSLGLAAAIAVAACTSTATNNTHAPSVTRQNMSPKEQVRALIVSIETGDHAPIAAIDAQHYKQHNLGAADGLAGFGELMSKLPKGSARARPVRVFQDGDFVFAHTQYDFFGPKIGFDVFRYEGGKIVEHWDNLQTTPSAANPSGHTMIDGATEVVDLDRTAANKEIVGAFLDDVLVHGRMDKLATYFDGDAYVQHNPQVADGLSGLGAALAEMAKHGVVMKYAKVHRVLGEGNFVLAVSEGTFGDKPTAFYDLFRVHAGKLAEHWDVIETIPPRSEWKNDNGKF